MNNTQSGLLRLLKEIDFICTEHNIKYYLAGGSLVGAVRHRGFLPWDDDADIHMPLKDALAFRDLFKTGKVPNDRALVSYLDYGETPAVHWGYVDTSTSALFRSYCNFDTPQGQFIDIFVLHQAPSPEVDKNKFLEMYDVYRELYYVFPRDSRRSKSFVKKFKRWDWFRRFGGKRIMHRYFRKRLFEIPDNSSDEYLILSPGASQPIVKKDLFGDPRRVKFEDTELCIAEKAEELLAFSYGSDWINVPRQAERGSHILISDSNVPYTEYFKILDSLYSRKKGLKSDRKYKHKWLNICPARGYCNPRTREMSLILKAKELEKEWDEEDILKRYSDVKTNQAPELLEIFSRYYKEQFASPVNYYSLFLPINEDYFYLAVFALVMSGDYRRCLNLLDRWNRSVGPLTNRLGVLKRICVNIDVMMLDLWAMHDYRSADAIIRKNMNGSDVSVSFMRANAFLHVNNILKEHCREDCLAEILQYRAVYPNDAELMYWHGKVLRDIGQIAEARKLFEDACEGLSNGLLFMDAKEIMEKDYGVIVYD